MVVTEYQPVRLLWGSEQREPVTANGDSHCDQKIQASYFACVKPSQATLWGGCERLHFSLTQVANPQLHNSRFRPVCFGSLSSR